jgi:hypothetical protein
MDSTQRRQQAEFVAAVLSSLAETDRFNVVMADVNRRAFPGPSPHAENRAAVQKN